MTHFFIWKTLKEYLIKYEEIIPGGMNMGIMLFFVCFLILKFSWKPFLKY